MKKYILALDSGTTSNRAILFDKQGRTVGSVQKEFCQIFPQPGWVEHDPDEIWSVQKEVMVRLLDKTNISANQIHALGITNQRETTIVWDRESGRPVYNAIVWQDRRTADYCGQLKKKGLEEKIRSVTGLPIDPYFSASKIHWILEHVEGAREKAEMGKLAFGTVDSWLVWKLTGGKCFLTDVSNASRTLLFNIHSLEWDKEMLDIFDIPENILPDVRSNSEPFGKVAAELFGEEIPISGLAGDQQAALFGQMCVEAGMVKNTYGTGCFVMMNTGSKAINSRHKLLTTIAWKIGDQVSYALEGSIFVGGAVVQWLRDKLKIIHTSEEIESLADRVLDSGGVYFVPAFVGLGAPHWDPYATGTIIGLNRDSSDAHIARAALEAIALQSMDVIQAMEKDASIRLQELRVDGGASVNNLLIQIQADCLSCRVVRPETTESTALGAAYLAGLATGFWKDLNELKLLWKIERTFNPSGNSEEIKKLIAGWNKALEKSKGWSLEKINEQNKGNN